MAAGVELKELAAQQKEIAAAVNKLADIFVLLETKLNNLPAAAQPQRRNNNDNFVQRPSETLGPWRLDYEDFVIFRDTEFQINKKNLAIAKLLNKHLNAVTTPAEGELYARWAHEVGRDEVAKWWKGFNGKGIPEGL